MPKTVFNRRQFLKAGLGLVGGIMLPSDLALAEDTATTLETLSGLFVAFVNRATGRIEAVKTFAEVNPELAEHKTASTPYRAPNQNVWLGKTTSLFQLDVKRYGIVDIQKRNETLGFFSSLKDSYTPGEYTHHFLLTLSDRELGREEVGGWALGHASDAQKKAALDLLHRIHKGLNGRYITEDPERMAEATRYYTGRELLIPVLYRGAAPGVGELAFLPQAGIEIASNGALQLAYASGAVTGGVEVGDSAANDMSVAAKGATDGTVSSVSAAIGGAAGAGASAGGSSDAGDGGSGSGGGGSSSSGSDCFTAETPILMADGTVKAICAIQIGDEVASYDTRACRHTTAKVSKLYRAEADHHLDLHGLRVTSGHPFAGPNGDWIKAGDLRAGSTLVTADGETTLHSITRHDGPIDIFNMTVDGTHTYYVVPTEDREGETLHGSRPQQGLVGRQWRYRRHLSLWPGRPLLPLTSGPRSGAAQQGLLVHNKGSSGSGGSGI